MLRAPLFLGLGLIGGLIIGCGEKEVDDSASTDDTASGTDDSASTDDSGTATEDCTNGADDDGDGDVDCDDSDCAADEACQATEDCATAGDEDGDGAADCADDDCAAEASCECLDGGALGNTTGEVATGDGTTLTNDFEGACGLEGGLDTAFAWTVPADDCYSINTYGSGYDTVLRLFDACGGTEQVCDDDSDYVDGLQSDIRVPGAAGETWVIVVDAYWEGSLADDDTGFDTGAPFDPTYILNIETFTPEDGDLPEAQADIGDATGDAVASGSNEGSENSVELGCTSSGAGSWTWSWTAPSTATYQIDTINSDFDTVLGVFGGASTVTCQDGGEQSCNDDFSGLQSGVEISAEAGNTYHISVAGFGGATGNIVVNINEVTAE